MMDESWEQSFARRVDAYVHGPLYRERDQLQRERDRLLSVCERFLAAHDADPTHEVYESVDEWNALAAMRATVAEMKGDTDDRTD